MSYDDSGDNQLVQIPLFEIRRIKDMLARLRNENNLNQVLWVQVAGLYQRLRAQPGTRTATPHTQGQEQQAHGPSPTPLPECRSAHGG